jgi:3-deoxy-D-arabino-heptulosonate 7-phosphate (DAHP) synthase
MKFLPKDYDRFWSFVDKQGPDECWLWIGASTSGKGYGQFTLSGEQHCFKHRAHRVSYVIATGDDPGKYPVLHSCDTPPCCNPAHLRKGTYKENMQDKLMKSRQPKFYKTRLPDHILISIRNATNSQRAIAKQFGISQAYVSKIKNGGVSLSR